MKPLKRVHFTQPIPVCGNTDDRIDSDVEGILVHWDAGQKVVVLEVAESNRHRVNWPLPVWVPQSQVVFMEPGEPRTPPKPLPVKNKDGRVRVQNAQVGEAVETAPPEPRHDPKKVTWKPKGSRKPGAPGKGEPKGPGAK